MTGSEDRKTRNLKSDNLEAQKRSERQLIIGISVLMFAVILGLTLSFWLETSSPIWLAPPLTGVTGKIYAIPAFAWLVVFLVWTRKMTTAIRRKLRITLVCLLSLGLPVCCCTQLIFGVIGFHGWGGLGECEVKLISQEKVHYHCVTYGIDMASSVFFEGSPGSPFMNYLVSPDIWREFETPIPSTTFVQDPVYSRHRTLTAYAYATFDAQDTLTAIRERTMTSTPTPTPAPRYTPTPCATAIPSARALRISFEQVQLRFW